MKETILILEGLNCAHCASKIETLVNKLDYVDNACLNFMSKKLTIEHDSKTDNDIFEDVKRIVKRLEPDVVVMYENDDEHDHELCEACCCGDEQSCCDSHEQMHENSNSCCCGEDGHNHYSNTNSNHDKNSHNDHNQSCNNLEHSSEKNHNNCCCSHEDEESHNNCCCSHEDEESHNNCCCSHEDEESHNNGCCSHDNHNHDSQTQNKNISKKNHKADSHEHSHNHSGETNKKDIIKIAIAAVLFLSAVIFESNNTLSMILSLVSYVIVGYEIVITAFKNLFRGQVFDENFLMTVASLGAFIIGEYPEAAGVMLFYTVGEYCQGLAVNKSRGQIKSLLNLKPEYANIKSGDKLTRVSPEAVKIGDLIVIKSGEKVPLDGVIVEGSTSLNTSALTGESMPVDKAEGDEVLSGSINESGLITVRVTKTFKESTVSKILYMVEKAANKKSHTENFISKFARYYTPIVVIIAVLIAVIPSLLFSLPISVWAYKGLTFLVVSCPCALVLSIPLTYFSGIGRASKDGILIKGGNYLEALSSAEIAVFDKTGTLTEGKFSVIEVNTQNNYSTEKLVEIAAYGEYYSNHPIATSVKQKFNGTIDEKRISEYKELAGHGIQTKLDGKVLLVGNYKLMNKNNIVCNEIKDKPGTTLYVAYDNMYAGNIIISDSVKKDAINLTDSLKAVGIKKTVMLTGDNRVTAEYVKNKLSIDTAYSDLLPTDKVNKVEEIFAGKTQKGKLLFVGDGINDAPVLTRADVGIAMGGIGSDAAIESADVVLMNDEPSKIVDSIKIAKRTKTIVWENIIFALGVKLLVMILTICINVKMPLAVFADVGVAIIAVLNASRILKFKLK